MSVHGIFFLNEPLMLMMITGKTNGLCNFHLLTRLVLFVSYRMVADPCYKALEEQIIRTKVVRETVFQVLGVLIKKYNHGTSCLIKLVQVT